MSALQPNASGRKMLKGGAEAPTRRLSLPIPKRRSPPSRPDPEHQHPADDGVYGQSPGFAGQVRKYFCAVSPSHSSDASTIDESEEAPAMRVSSECQHGGGHCIPDITSLCSLGQLIGTGSQSFVYQCHWAEGVAALVEGPLCIKHIVGDSAREALMTACQVMHPNVARHFATYDDWRGLWVLMEYVRGPDLAAYVQRVGRLSEKTIKHIFRQIICALECIHSHNLVHQDVKLENIVVREASQRAITSTQDSNAADTPEGSNHQRDLPEIEIALVDFGSAEVVRPHQSVNNPKPESSPAGTAMYMAPEAFLENPVDCKSDIWSAGILLCLLLSGRSPFEGQSIMHTLGRSRSSYRLTGKVLEKRHASVLTSRRATPAGNGTEQIEEPGDAVSAERGSNGSCHSSEMYDKIDSPAGPEAVRDRLFEAFKRPEWHAVPAEAKELISEMLTVDAKSRPSAAKIMQNSWLTSL